MALSEPVKALLALVKDEARRALLTTAFEEEALLQEAFAGNLRQSDYDRLMNQAKKDREDIDKRALAAEARAVAADKKSKDWEDWMKTNKPRHDKLVTDFATLETEKAQLASELEKLKLEGVDVDQAELTKIIEGKIGEFEKRYGDRPNREELNKIVADSVSKLTTDLEGRFNQQVMPAWSKFQLDMSEVMYDHQQEFGSKLDRKAFMQFMADNHTEDPIQAHALYVSELRDKAKQEKYDKEKKEAIDAAVKDALSKASIPGSGVGVAPSVDDTGVLQLRRQKTGLPEIPEEVSVGDGRLAALAAAALRAEGRV